MFAQSEKIDQVLPALLEARKNFRKVEKDRENNHLKNKYATLDAVLEVVNPPLLEQGLMLEQSMLPDSQPTFMKVVTTVRHVSGQSVSWLMCMPVESQKCQGAGSAFSYAKRYALIGCFGLEQDDDDGNGANYSLNEWRKIFEKCETEADLKKEFAKAWVSLDGQNKDLAKEAYDKKLASFTVGEAAAGGKGFKPATEKQRQATKSDVQAKAEPQAAAPSQNIESFD